MRLLPWRRDAEPEPVRLFCFHLDALQTSVIHPKFMSDKLVASLDLSGEDQEYAGSIDQFIDYCSGMNGAPTTPDGRNHILAIIGSCAKTSRPHSSTIDSAFTNWKNFNQLSSHSGTDRLS